MAVATVHDRQVVPYVGAMFFFGELNHLCNIESIQSGTAFCSYLNADLPPFHIALDAVAELIASFGNSH
jgi:hypothetical protein